MTAAKESKARIRLLACAIALAVVVVYANSLIVPFVFDDDPSISQNTTIRHLLDLGQIFDPPSTAGATIQGRPILNASFALSYALSGYRVWGYHLLNIAIHAAAALVLFGVVRRSLGLAPMKARFAQSATALAFFTALLWAVHPIQTESVTYIVQRAESLMGLFYLLTLYCFIRGTSEEKGAVWLGLSVIACACGMGTKEVMVSAPLVVLVFDSFFVSGSVRRAIAARGPYYAGLLATLALLVLLVRSTGWNRGATIGANVSVTAWAYALTQLRAVTLYLKLSLWPDPLVFDYGTQWVRTAGEVIPYALCIAVLLTVSIAGFMRRTSWAFMAFCFFAVLSPSSSIVPGTRQTMAEHRMYLPLAAVLIVITCALFQWLGRRSFGAFALIALVFAALSVRRNTDYRSVIALYRDTVEKVPENRFAENNYGDVLFKSGDAAGALPYFEAAVKLDPAYVDARHNLGSAQMQLGRTDQAIEEFQEALKSDPHFAEAENNLGNAYLKVGKTREAIEAFEKAIRDEPNFAEAHYDLANTLIAKGSLASATAQYREAIRCSPDNAEMHNNYAIALARAGDFDHAISEFERAIALKPGDAGAHLNLANALASTGRLAEAIPHYRQALAIQPDFPAAAHFLQVAEEQLRAKSGQ